MPWGWGRGWRWWFYATGLPGWMRAGMGWPAFGRGFGWATWPTYNWFGRCRWFPWLPRWWWSGIYGPVTWTSMGPMLTSQTAPQSFTPTSVPYQPASEIEALRQEKKMLEEELKYIEERLKELSEKK